MPGPSSRTTWPAPPLGGSREHAALIGDRAVWAGQLATEAVRKRARDEHGYHHAQEIAPMGVEGHHADAPGAARRLARVLARPPAHEDRPHPTRGGPPPRAP